MQAAVAKAVQIAVEGFVQILPDVAKTLIQFAPVGKLNTHIKTANDDIIGVTARVGFGKQAHGNVKFGDDVSVLLGAIKAVCAKHFCQLWIEKVTIGFCVHMDFPCDVVVYKTVCAGS